MDNNLEMRFLLDKSRKLPSILASYVPVAKSLAKTFNTEVVLHDLRYPEKSLFLIAGNVTKRSLGAPCTDRILELIRSKKDPDDLLNYLTRLEDGRIIKSSIIFIKDINKRSIGCMGINYDLKDINLIRNILTNICPISNNIEKREKFSNNIKDIISAMILEAKDKIKKPDMYMDKDDKVKIIKDLDQKGAFVVKNSVKMIAEELGVSRYTIYNYIKEIDRNR